MREPFWPRDLEGWFVAIGIPVGLVIVARILYLVAACHQPY